MQRLPPIRRVPEGLARAAANRPKLVIAIVLVLLCAVVTVLVSHYPWSPGSVLDGYRVDLDVYQRGARRWLDGQNLFLPIHPARSHPLPFLYPPLSAILFAPFALQPFGPASVEITLLSVSALACALWVVLRSLRPAGTLAGRWLLLGVLLPLALLFEPVRQTLGYGQINLLLMGMVTLDCLARSSRWPRGVLVGLAAAIKLTPAAFLLLFLLRKDWRALALAGVSFVVSTGIGALLDWPDSLAYWTKIAYQTNRINIGVVANQSITAVLMRLGLHSPVRGAVWLVLAAMVLVVAVLAIRRAINGGHLALAVSLNGVFELLVSPISWSHHWVWSVPLVVSLVALGRRSKAVLPLLAAAVATALFTTAPQWQHPVPSTWGFAGNLVGNCYVYLGVALLLGAAFLPVRTRWDVKPGGLRRPGRLSTAASVSQSTFMIGLSLRT
ncbi:MAG TPA: glycosyltransferase 87 family protein [Pseudonocardiaceae bacterium]|nr:glycosyltransferase 87 family protein [Pseudonocardiaceae bacterium]